MIVLKTIISKSQFSPSFEKTSQNNTIRRGRRRRCQIQWDTERIQQHKYNRIEYRGGQPFLWSSYCNVLLYDDTVLPPCYLWPWRKGFFFFLPPFLVELFSRLEQNTITEIVFWFCILLFSSIFGGRKENSIWTKNTRGLMLFLKRLHPPIFEIGISGNRYLSSTTLQIFWDILLFWANYIRPTSISTIEYSKAFW